MARMFDEHTPLPAAKPILTEHADRLTPHARPGDHAQAVMDLGATICTPKSPACGICPWRAPCKARAQGTAQELPKKTPKKVKPIRHGTVYLAQRSDGAWLVETRHTFTHFHLILDVMVAQVADTEPDRGYFLPRDQFRPSDLPTVMRKAFDLAQS